MAPAKKIPKLPETVAVPEMLDEPDLSDSEGYPDTDGGSESDESVGEGEILLEKKEKPRRGRAKVVGPFGVIPKGLKKDGKYQLVEQWTEILLADPENPELRKEYLGMFKKLLHIHAAVKFNPFATPLKVLSPLREFIGVDADAWLTRNEIVKLIYQKVKPLCDESNKRNILIGGSEAAKVLGVDKDVIQYCHLYSCVAKLVVKQEKAPKEATEKPKRKSKEVSLAEAVEVSV